MADLLSAFEQQTYSSSSRRAGGAVSEPSSLNPFEVPSPVSASLDPGPIERKQQEYPILRRQDVNKIRVPSHITHIAASNDYLTIAVLGNTIYRFDTKNLSGQPVEISDIKREDEAKIHKLFQDPWAQHLIVSMDSKEAYYVGRGGPKKPQPRLLPKLKGHQFESVAWNKLDRTEHSTGPILLGTSMGLIYEADIEVQEALLPVGKRKNYFVEVYKLMSDLTEHPEPVTGMQLEPFPRHSGADNRWFVLVTTPRRIYQFIGQVNRGDTPLFLEMFTFYTDYVKIQFLEIPGSLQDSQLSVWPASPKKSPRAFAWLTGAGVYYGNMTFGDHKPGESLFTEKNLIPYSAACDSGDDRDQRQKDTDLPVGLSLTEFHCVLLYRDRVVALCHLNNKKVFEEHINVRRDGPLYTMTTDPVNGHIWTHARLKLLAYSLYKETRNVWKIYLDRNNFETAKRYAEGNQKNLDTILVRQADHYFREGRYEDAAEVFSKSNLSFEEVTLKFIQVDKKQALKLFLIRKLESLSEHHKTQQTMLTTWLIELYLNELGTLLDDGKTDVHAKIQDEFHMLLAKPALRECLEANKKTIYDLMSSHGASDDIIHFAELMRDYDRVIRHHVQNHEYRKALGLLAERSAEVLTITDKHERRAVFSKFGDLYYKYSPVLLKHIPDVTVSAWATAGKLLDPKKLIVALTQCSQQDEDDPAHKQLTSATIKYLEYCVDQLRTDQVSVHNFLISSYANSTNPSHHRKLLEYVKKQDQVGCMPQYDAQYALRLCLEKGLQEPCVHIYSSMSLFEEGVTLALSLGKVDLAHHIISRDPMISRDKQLEKKLWLRIAEHVIKKERDIRKAMQFLKECGGVLKIEDILPFFSDVVTIDQFKDAICDSLQAYNVHIDNLKKEMDGATESAKNIREDIQDIRNKCVLIRSDHKCEICETRLLSQSFYMFPCRHAFHKECLVGEVIPLMDDKDRRGKLEHLIRELDATKNKEPVKRQIDDLVSGDCPYCGLMMIGSVGLPLLPVESWDRTMSNWK